MFHFLATVGRYHFVKVYFVGCLIGMTYYSARPGRNLICARSDSLSYYSDRTCYRSSWYFAETRVVIDCLIVNPGRIDVVGIDGEK